MFIKWAKQRSNLMTSYSGLLRWQNSANELRSVSSEMNHETSCLFSYVSILDITKPGHGVCMCPCSQIIWEQQIVFLLISVSSDSAYVSITWFLLFLLFCFVFGGDIFGATANFFPGLASVLFCHFFLNTCCFFTRCGGTVGAILTCPLEVVKTRLQSSSVTLYVSEVQLSTVNGASVARVSPPGPLHCLK